MQPADEGDEGDGSLMAPYDDKIDLADATITMTTAAGFFVPTSESNSYFYFIKSDSPIASPDTGLEVKYNEALVSSSHYDVTFSSDGETFIPYDSDNDMFKGYSSSGPITVKVTAKDDDTDYAGSATTGFCIVSYDLNKLQGATVTLENSKSHDEETGLYHYVYSASQISPEVKVEVVEGEGENEQTVEVSSGSYNVSYGSEERTNVSGEDIAVYVHAYGQPEEDGKKVQFRIDPFDISTSVNTITLTDSAPTYTGSEIKPTVSSFFISALAQYLTSGTDFEISGYRNNVKAASSTDSAAPAVVITGKGNYTGEASKTFTISATYISNASYDAIKVTYDGTEQKPKPTLKFNGSTLTEGTDYTISSYYSNTSAGTGYFYVYGMGNFSSSQYISFTIEARKISLATASKVAAQEYTASAITPTVTLTDLGKTLERGTDYTLSYSSNTNPGKATITVTGKGNYQDTKAITFTIKKTGTVPKVTIEKAGSGKVRLSWKPIYGATKYSVSEKLPDGSVKVFTKNCTSTYGSISNLSATRKHRFLVRAYVNKEWSSNSDKYLVSIKPSGATKPSVRGKSVSDSSVQLDWDYVPGATRYAVSVQATDGSFNLLTDSRTSNTILLTELEKNRTYTYVVQAYIDKKWSKYTKADYVKVSPSDPNPPVVTAKATKTNGQVSLSWSKVRMATKYSVSEKLPSGKWKTYTKKLKKTKYTISNLSTSRTHKFRVRAYANGKWSKVYTDYDVTATPNGPKKPEPSVSATTANSVTLKWAAVPAAKKYSVAIQQANGKLKKYTTKLKKTSYTIGKLASGQSYKVLVQAYVDGAWTTYKDADFVTATTK